MKNRFIPYIFMLSLTSMFLAPLHGGAPSPELTALEQGLGALKAKLAKLGGKLDRLVNPLHAQAKDLKTWLDLKKGSSKKVLSLKYLRDENNYSNPVAAKVWIDMIGDWTNIKAELKAVKNELTTAKTSKDVQDFQRLILAQLHAYLNDHTRSGIPATYRAPFANSESNWIDFKALNRTALFAHISSIAAAFNHNHADVATNPADYAELIENAKTANTALTVAAIRIMFGNAVVSIMTATPTATTLADEPASNSDADVTAWLNAKLGTAGLKHGKSFDAATLAAGKAIITAHTAVTQANTNAATAIGNIAQVLVGPNSYADVVTAIKNIKRSIKAFNKAKDNALDLASKDANVSCVVASYDAGTGNMTSATLHVVDSGNNVLPLTPAALEELALVTAENKARAAAHGAPVTLTIDLSSLDTAAKAEAFIDGLVTATTEADVKTWLDALDTNQFAELKKLADGIHTNVKDNDKINWIVGHVQTPPNPVTAILDPGFPALILADRTAAINAVIASIAGKPAADVVAVLAQLSAGSIAISVGGVVTAVKSAGYGALDQAVKDAFLEVAAQAEADGQIDNAVLTAIAAF
ncbi:hypothetical protein K2W90_03545 [Candidatus Babeliales bacterium]|nr:hypothetical protein [Candidatus Babeliales bacterium]